MQHKTSFQIKNNKVIPNLIWNLPHKLFMNKTTLSGRFRIRVRNDFMSKRRLRGRFPSASRTRFFRDNGLYVCSLFFK